MVTTYTEKNYRAQRKYLDANPKQVMLNHARQRARKKGIDCTITVDDIVIPETCPYLGLVLVRSLRGTKTKSSPALDRIDPSKGYVPGNVQVISDLANRMKSDASPEELVKFARGVISLQ